MMIATEFLYAAGAAGRHSAIALCVCVECVQALLEFFYFFVSRFHAALDRTKGLFDFVEMGVHKNTSKSLKVVREMFA